MNRFRPALNAILGLLLMVQGVAVASTEMAMPALGDTASTMAAMPCHGDQNSGGEPQSCCDSDCPNMASCALGHLAVASAQGAEFVGELHPAYPALVLAPATLPPPSFLRPPIAFHV